jgi:hypothetical protein
MARLPPATDSDGWRRCDFEVATVGDMTGDAWEQRMAARAAGRAAERTTQRRQPLDPDRPGHAGHHLHRTPLGTECSCGADSQEACYVDEGESHAWWRSGKCAICGRQGLLLEGLIVLPTGTSGD